MVCMAVNSTATTTMAPIHAFAALATDWLQMSATAMVCITEKLITEQFLVVSFVINYCSCAQMWMSVLRVATLVTTTATTT